MARCPMCSAQDRTSKVSAVVRSGTTTTRTTGSSKLQAKDQFTQLHHTVGQARHSTTTRSQSSLAAQLSFPSGPRPPVRFARGFGILLFAMATVTLSVNGVLALVPAVVTGLLVHRWGGGSAKTALLAAVGLFYLVGTLSYLLMDLGVHEMTGFLLTLAMSLTYAALGLALVLWDLRRAEARRKQSNADSVHRQRSWQAWQRLYYCSRDDVVFDPLTRACAPPSAMRRLIGYPGAA
ncbi:hypothetical protein [Nocardiopsis metallicus]|uniref:Uncharacterized protein n=1 Tax=Nocardiopsis metallicus TaxID=179819 RepID=A0A840W3X6_9ACTN|nr:hypothetical protein [Nocardiopsis metallicus]MBB5490684.1 hypothetical protein [Nocardiopsis metallicus]